MKKAFLGAFALSLVAALTACDGASSTNNPVQNPDENSADSGNNEKGRSSDSKASDKEASSNSNASNGIATFDDLPNCSKSREGERNFVEDEEITYICTSGKWVHFNSVIDSVKTTDDLPACQTKLEGDSAYVADKLSYFVCSNKKWTQQEVLMQLYSSADDLPNCSQKYEGIQALISEENIIYRCNDGRWAEYIKVYASEDDMPNCTEKRTGETAYVQKTAKMLICSNDKWSDWNGETIELPKSSAAVKSSSSSAPEPKSSSDKVEVSSSSQKTVSSSSVVPSSSSKKVEPSSSSEQPKSSSSSVAPSSSSKKVDPVSSSSGFACANAMWCGPRGDLQVNTGSEDLDHGWWFVFSDRANTNLVSGGNSKFIWPIEETGCDEYGINCTDALNPIIRAKKAVEGRFVLGAQLVYNDGTKINPYAAVAFNTHNSYHDGMDITSWRGLCITYTATDNLQLRIEPQNTETVDGYNNYKVLIKKASTTKTVNFYWSDFKQDENWGIEQDIEDILKWVAQINLYYTAAPNSTNSFKITAFGKYGTCN